MRRRRRRGSREDYPYGLHAFWNAEQTPVTSSADSKVSRLLEAARNGEALTSVYYGGSSPGAQRTIHPRAVFGKSGFGSAYVRAYCEKRQEERTFRIDAIQIVGAARSSQPAVTSSVSQSGLSSPPSRGGSERTPQLSSTRKVPQGTGCMVSLAILVIQITGLALSIWFFV